jgi:rhamnosyltransferase
MNLAATVILFQPLPSVIENIRSYINEVDKLYIIDNSEVKDKDLIQQIENISNKCKLLINPGNQGIAKALNQAVELAASDGFEWLLTMDQDSRFYRVDYFNKFKKNCQKDQIAVFVPQIISNTSEIEPAKNIECKITNEPFITSGSILNIEICQKLGVFEEKLFIDEVDTDYYFKVLNHNFKIVLIEGTYLIHNQGKKRIIHFLFHKPLRIFEHPPFRHYYITRNFFYLLRKYFRTYPGLVLNRGRKVFFVKTMHGLLFHQNRGAVLKFTIKGIIDFLCNKYGVLK